MQRAKILALRSHRRQYKKDERGVALITTLLLLMLLTGLTLTMAWSSRSDMLINGYYRNFRGAFYAADSGLNVIRQAALNQFTPGVGIPAVFTAGALPIPAGTDAAITKTINDTYDAGFTSITGAGTSAGSWPGQFKLPNNASFSLVQTGCDVVAPPPKAGLPPWSCPGNLPPSATQFTFRFNYSILVQGQSRGGENASLSDRGQITLTADVVNASSTTSFAAWGMFIATSNICDGSTLVPGTISGPVFTNGSWNFGTGKYTFTDSVGSAGAKEGYQNGSCQQVAGPSGNGISPTFQKGLNVGQPTVPLPTNDFNQQRAVLDGEGTAGQPSPSDMNNSLRDAQGNSYPNSGSKPSSGVFLPYTAGSGGNPPTFTGGGIMVEGDASVVLSPSGAAGQTYKITQGSNTTIVTTDPTPKPGFPNGTTIVSVNGKTTETISGVPTQTDPATGTAMGPDTMLYVDGNITSLSGPAQGSPAINDGTALTITAAKNVTLTGDLTYKTPPVTLTANGSTPADSLIPGNDNGQALGIFTSTGNIVLNDTQINPKTGKFDGNMEIDASLATISQGGSGSLINPNAQLNQLTIVGGRIQNNISNINTLTRDVLFDVRYANGKFSPPWFPSTSQSPGGFKSAQFEPVKIQRLSWQNQTPYY